MTLVRNLKWMMVVLALIAAGCGGGDGDGDDESGTATTLPDSPEQADNNADSGGAVVSADGALTVIAPDGSGVVTLVEAEGIEEFDSVSGSLRAYELGGRWRVPNDRGRGRRRMVVDGQHRGCWSRQLRV